MIIEEDVELILTDGGFLSAFTDFKGNAQPAPVLQLITFDEDATYVQGKRILFIREGGSGGGSRYVQRSGVSIVFAGLQTKADAAIVKDYADRIFTYLLSTRTKCGIINIDPIAGASPVMYTDLGRPVVEIQCTLLTDRGIT
tara:strand:+ start:243 stop:668 length:426 start_codon:yes stop_codon:yes gene_type:complete